MGGESIALSQKGELMSEGAVLCGAVAVIVVSFFSLILLMLREAEALSLDTLETDWQLRGDRHQRHAARCGALRSGPSRWRLLLREWLVRRRRDQQQANTPDATVEQVRSLRWE